RVELRNRRHVEVQRLRMASVPANQRRLEAEFRRFQHFAFLRDWLIMPHAATKSIAQVTDRTIGGPHLVEILNPRRRVRLALREEVNAASILRPRSRPNRRWRRLDLRRMRRIRHRYNP